MRKRRYCILFLLLLTLSACADHSSTSEEVAVSSSQPVSSTPTDPSAEQETSRVAEDSPEEAQTSEAMELDTRPRTFYRYTTEDVIWDYDASHFPPQWLDAAKTVADAESEHYDGTFSRGWQYDISGDGRMEGILLFQVLEGNADLWGNSFFIYVSADGEAQILTMGQDEEFDDWRKMDIELLHYQGFTHVFVRSGANNMTSGSFGMIYREGNGALEKLFSDSWFSFEDSDVFFETQGPQGQGPAHYFWDAVMDRYSAVGGTEISPEEFLRVFDADRIIGEGLYDIDVELLEEKPPAAYTADLFTSIEVFGNRYYQLMFEEKQPLFFAIWEKTADQQWRYVSVGTGPMRHVNEAMTVHQIDMFEAEERAIG